MPTPKLAVAILLLLITSIYLYQTRHASDQGFIPPSSAGNKYKMAENALLSNLTVSLRQASSDPITVAIIVKNENSVPVTILAWNSPLDPLALQLGSISITPSGSSTPLDIPIIKVSRKLPPGEDSIIELGPGQTSRDNVVEFKEIVVGKQLREKQVQKAAVKLAGEWRAVWPVSRSELSSEIIEGMGSDDKAVSGEFQSEELEVSVN